MNGGEEETHEGVLNSLRDCGLIVQPDRMQNYRRMVSHIIAHWS